MEIKRKIYFSTKALICCNGKFLALHKTFEESNLLELPGGCLEFGETAEETLLREIKEETKLEFELILILDTWNYISTDFQITGVIFLCKSNNTNVVLSDEHDGFKWLDLTTSSAFEMVDVFKERMKEWNWDKIKVNLCKGENII